MTTADVAPAQDPMVYQGEFGPFTIDHHDRQEVIRYRAGLTVAALAFAIATGGVLWRGEQDWVLTGVSLLYTVFWLALGFSLLHIHIYLRPLHRLLQGFWLVGGLASLGVAHFYSEPFALTVYHHPATLWGIGFTFAALTGIFFKEAFCFNRVETKVLTPIVPFLLLGHLFGFLPAEWSGVLLAFWSANFLLFALRKVIQPIPPDIGDKSVFDYLEQQRQQQASSAS